MDGNRMEDPLDGRRARLATHYRIIRHSLHDLEGVTLLTAVLVDRHCFKKYSVNPLALSTSECQSVPRR